MSKVVLYLLFAVGAIGCASAPINEEPALYFEAEKTSEPAPPPRVVAVPVVHAMPGQARPAPRAKIPDAESVEAAISKADANEKPWELIDAANEAARSGPIEDGYFNSMQVYDYAPGALYQVYSAQGRITAITFSPGERVRSVALGDSLRWITGQTESGSGADLVEMVLIKPIRPGLTTNAVITTNYRTYQLELRSFRESYMAAVSWEHPTMEIKKYLANESSQMIEGAASEAGVGVAKNVSDLNFSYGFKVKNPKKTPSWMPLRVFDDGQKTYIQFAKQVRERELPAFFILSRTGQPIVANYRVAGDYMVVDQVFDLAKLRLAEAGDNGETVGIERLGGQ